MAFNRKRKKALKKSYSTKHETEHKLTLRYKPHPKQKLFADAIEAGKRVALFLGGIRSGKTYWGARESVKQIYKYCKSPNLGWIVSPTYPMSLIAEREFEDAAGELIIKKLRGERAYLLHPHKKSSQPFRVEVKSADNPDRLRGSGLAFIWGDEAAMFSEEAWKIMLGRVLDTKGQIFLTTTPMGKNWLYKNVYEESLKNPNYAVIRAKTSDNEIIDEEYLGALRNQYSAEFAKQELEGEFVSFEGLVYKNFDYNRHVVKPWTQIPKGVEVYGAIDVGFSDPFVHLWIAKQDGRYFVIDEYYEKQRTMEAHARSIKAGRFDSRVVRRWCDPSGAQERSDLVLRGIQTSPARNEIESGVNIVARCIETSRLYVASNCVHTIREFGEYSYPSREKRNSGEKPLDYANHCMDALRYGVYSDIVGKSLNPYFTTEEDGTIIAHHPEGSPMSNNLNDWISAPTYPVYDPDESEYAEV